MKALFRADEQLMRIRCRQRSLVQLLSDADEQAQAGAEAGGGRSERRLQLARRLVH